MRFVRSVERVGWSGDKGGARTINNNSFLKMPSKNNFNEQLKIKLFFLKLVFVTIRYYGQTV